MMNMNDEYMSRMRLHLSFPHHLGVIAPYGSRRTFGQADKIRKGVLDLLTTGAPALCTFTRLKGKYKVYAAPRVLQFRSGTSPEEIRSRIHEEFQNLKSRAFGQK
jgi:hypothetical protein